MTQEFDVPLDPDGNLTLPEPLRTALDLAPGHDVRFLLNDDGTVEVVNPRPVAITVVDPEWLTRLRQATERAMAAQVLAVLDEGIPSGALMWAALGLLVALEQEQPGAADLAVTTAARLEERGWRGDDELAELLRDKAAGRSRGRPGVPADLTELAQILDHDANTGLRGFLNLDDGEVMPGEFLDDAPELRDEIDEGNWVSVDVGGSRAAWRDMEWFAEMQEPRLRRRLLAAIEGRGAFRRFRNAIYDEPEEVERAWRQFSAARADGRAVEWLAASGYDVVPRVLD